MDLDLVKIVGITNEALYSYLKRHSNRDNVVVVDLEGMSKLFSMKPEHNVSSVPVFITYLIITPNPKVINI